MTIDRDKRDDDLRELLREWDPARDDEGLAPTEAGRMRRAVVEASVRRSAWAPRLAWGSAAAAALLLVALAGRGLLWETRSPLPAVDKTPGVGGPGDGSPTVTPTTAAPASELPAIPPVTEPAATAAASSAPGPVEPERVVTASLPEAVPARDPRQIQFTAPGGTRIIWTLDPEFRL